MKNEYVRKIRSLFLPFQVDSDSIHTGINKYIDTIDMETERLERGFTNNDKVEYKSALSNIQFMLRGISAKRHEAYTVTLMRDRESNKFTGKILQQALADFLLLSIELQKAQSAKPSFSSGMTDIEKSEEAASNLAAFIHYIDAQDYDMAKEFASDMTSIGMNVSQLIASLNVDAYDIAKKQAATMQQEYSDKINAVDKTKSSKAVLAVDDRPEILTNISSALRAHYKTLGAPSGKVALEIINQHDIGLFILDIEMPEMDGFTLASQIRKVRDHAKTPILFLTANSSRERIKKALDLGAEDFIVKPAYNETLLSRVKKYMN